MLTVIRRRDHEKRMARYHLIALHGSLLGGIDIVHEWGRIGSPGAVQRIPCEDETKAAAAAAGYLNRKRRKGYL